MYIAATVIPTNIKIFQWARPDHPNPRLAAPIRSSETTAKFTSMPKDYAGNNITGAFFMGVRRASDGLVTNFYVPAAAINATTLTATGLVRIRTNGLDYTTADDINAAIDHNADDQVFCAYAPVFEQMLYSVWTGALGLSASAIPYYASAPTFTPGSQQLCTIAYADALAIAGSPNSSTTTKGLVEQATQAEYDARTITGGTGAPVFVNPGTVRGLLYNDYAATVVGTDSYAITITPAITAYAAGQVFTFKADVANTGACTLAVSGLTAKALKVFGGDPVSGYIGAGSIVMCEYDGTNMQILSVGNQSVISQTGAEIYGGASVAGTDTYAATLNPPIAAYVTGEKFSFATDVANTGAATINYNTVGALNLKKWYGGSKVDLETNDLAAGMNVVTAYDGVDMVVQSPLNIIAPTSAVTTYALNTASGTTTIAHGLGRTPKRIRLTAIRGENSGTSNPVQSVGTYNGSVTRTIYHGNTGGVFVVGTDTTNVIYLIQSTGNSQAATATMDATNVTLTWTKTGSPDETAAILLEAFPI